MHMTTWKEKLADSGHPIWSALTLLCVAVLLAITCRQFDGDEWTDIGGSAAIVGAIEAVKHLLRRAKNHEPP